MLAGAGLLFYCVQGHRRGRITPMIRSYRIEPYERKAEPRRYWASLIYNGVVGSACLIGGAAGLWAEERDGRERPFREACLAEQKNGTPYEVIEACNRWLTDFRPSAFDLGLARQTQADAHATLGEQREATLMRRAAIGAYGRSLSGFPEDSAAYWNIAMLSLSENDFAQARQSLQAYVEVEPDRGDGWLELGLLELQAGDLPNAIVHLTQAVERLPGESRPLAARGIAYGFAGDHMRAAADVEAARKVDPAEPLVNEADRLFAAGSVAPLTSRTQQ